MDLNDPTADPVEVFGEVIYQTEVPEEAQAGFIHFLNQLEAANEKYHLLAATIDPDNPPETLNMGDIA